MIILELSHGYASSQGYSCTATSQSSPARGSGQHGPSHGRDVYICERTRRERRLGLRHALARI